MSVNKSQRTEGKLLVNELARDLAAYTIQITSNPKVFLPKYQTALTDEIVKCAISIHKHAWTANNVMVRGQSGREHYTLRRQNQELAIVECNNLLSLIDIAKPLFHLSGKRCQYWGKKTIEVRNKIRGWIESDAKRYAEYRMVYKGM